MHFLSDYGLFLLKTLTLVLAILFVIAASRSKGKKTKPALEITSLNEEYETMHRHIQKIASGKKLKKVKKSVRKKALAEKPALYLLDFKGDIQASQAEPLRDEISAILSVATTDDEVLVCVESGGGSVPKYGFAASQLQRLRDHHIPLTVSVDTIAASGGYLMSCVANYIIAAPFAIIGSIGVVAQVPNLHRWLKKHDIDVELLTAGEYKRTLTVLGENTEKGREKFKEDLEKIHKAFRQYVLSHRQDLDIEKVATGEHWLAQDAIGLGLVDTLATSDEYILQKLATHRVFKVTQEVQKSRLNRLLKPFMHVLGLSMPHDF